MEELSFMSKKVWSKAERKLIVLEMIRGEKSVGQICKEYGIGETAAYEWKNKALAAIDNAFEKTKDNKGLEAEKDRLLRIIGEQSLVIDTLKKIVN
jgi:transposase-like protein